MVFIKSSWRVISRGFKSHFEHRDFPNGRSIPLANGENTFGRSASAFASNPISAVSKLNGILNKDNVRQRYIKGKYYEKPTWKRRRKQYEMWTRAYLDYIKKQCDLANKLATK